MSRAGAEVDIAAVFCTDFLRDQADDAPLRFPCTSGRTDLHTRPSGSLSNKPVHFSSSPMIYAWLAWFVQEGLQITKFSPFAKFSPCVTWKGLFMLLYFQRSLKLAAIASFGGCLLLAAAHPAAAQYAHLTLQSQPGDFVGGGVDSDVLFTPATSNAFFAKIKTSPGTTTPVTVDFVFDQFPSSDATLDFSTEQLGTALVPGTYTDAQRFPFESPGHPGLNVGFDFRASGSLTGNFTITNFSYSGSPQSGLVIDAFDATFEQHYQGEAPALFGQFSYRSTGSLPPAVPEASTTVSFGLLLALGMGGMVIAARKKKAAASA